MKVGLIAVDSKYPNLALMKISQWHKGQGDEVEWYNPLGDYERVYASKIFSYTPDYEYCINNAKEIHKGGTGYDLTTVLPPEIERLQPDYSIYPDIPKNTAYGFLTRGCPNKCKWCVVPQKEGKIAPYMDIEEIAVDKRKNIILMDNNVLASDYGLSQIEKIVRLGLRVDFNQALDARLVNKEIAELLSKVKWINRRIRFGCDTEAQIKHCDNVVALMEQSGFTGEFFFYCMLQGSFEECFSRVQHWRDVCKKKERNKYLPFCQPFRDISNPNQVIPQWQKDLARWVNRKELFLTHDFKDFEPRKGFKCASYYDPARRPAPVVDRVVTSLGAG